MINYEYITQEEIEEFKKEMTQEELEGYLDTQEWARGVMLEMEKHFS